MSIPQTLYISRLGPTRYNVAWMAQLHPILDRYRERLAWYSILPPQDRSAKPSDIPYQHGTLISRPAGSAFRTLRSALNLFVRSRRLGRRAAEFGRETGSKVVWADLSFETVVAGRVAAEELGVPLLVSIQDDPPSRLVRKDAHPRIIQRFQHEFERTLSRATACGVICSSMGDYYEKRYHCRTEVLFIGIDEHRALPAPLPPGPDTPVVIASVGSIVSRRNWEVLDEAVRLLVNQGRSVRILHIGTQPPGLDTPGVEFTGWLDDSELRRTLHRVHLCYLNQWFGKEREIMARTSFPSKVTTYIESQRPLIGLGPEYAAITPFIRLNNCGIVCTKQSAEALARAIATLIDDPAKYSEAVDGQKQLRRESGREKSFRRFEELLLTVVTNKKIQD